MKILLDTNVFIDMFQKRQPFMEFAANIISSCVQKTNIGYVSAHSLSDLFYILRKDFSSAERKECVRFICTYFEVISEHKTDFLAVANNERVLDMEDGLQMQCAAAYNLDYIVTRNVKDFVNSGVPAITPAELLALSPVYIEN